MDQIDKFIGKLYRLGSQIDAADFRWRALQELNQYLDFDAALWAVGQLEERQLHSSTHLNIPEDYTDNLAATADINPFFPTLRDKLCEPVDMAEVFPDAEFYHSDLYQRLFQPYGIERILGTSYLDDRSGLYSLISLYRFDRDNPFSEKEKQFQCRATYHLYNAASQAYFTHLYNREQSSSQSCSAVCDQHGVFHEVQPAFLDLLDRYFPHRSSHQLPFPVPVEDEATPIAGLHASSDAIGDLYCINLREQGPLDQLTEREQQIAEGISHGKTFKEIARELQLAPSTVSNHLYRIYNKLGISSRSQLAQLVYKDKE